MRTTSLFLGFSVVLSALLTSCGPLFQKNRSKREKYPKNPIQLDVSAFDNAGYTQGGNPFVFITQDAGDGSIFLCSGSLIDDYRVLTNNHCIENDEEGRLARPSELRIYFKEPNDAQEVSAGVTSIIDTEGSSESYRNSLFISELQDWALLELDQDMSAYKPLRLHGNPPALARGVLGPSVVLARFNPPESRQGGVLRATFDPVTGRVDTSDLEKSISRDLTRKKVDACEDRTEWGTEAYYACDEEKATDAEVNAELEKVLTVQISNTHIRQGNSGSAVLLDNKAYAVAHSGDRETDSSGDATTGYGQLIRSFESRLK